MRGRTCRQQQVEIVRGGGAQSGLPGRGRLIENVDGLTGAVLAGRRQSGLGGLPELGHRALLADDHAGAPVVYNLREGVAPDSRRYEVRPRVTKRGEATVPGQSHETAEAATGDVLEEDALDRILGAEREDLVKLGLFQRRHGV